MSLSTAGNLLAEVTDVDFRVRSYSDYIEQRKQDYELIMAIVNEVIDAFDTDSDAEPPVYGNTGFIDPRSSNPENLSDYPDIVNQLFTKYEMAPRCTFMFNEGVCYLKDLLKTLYYLFSDHLFHEVAIDDLRYIKVVNGKGISTTVTYRDFCQQYQANLHSLTVTKAGFLASLKENIADRLTVLRDNISQKFNNAYSDISGALENISNLLQNVKDAREFITTFMSQTDLEGLSSGEVESAENTEIYSITGANPWNAGTFNKSLGIVSNIAQKTYGVLSNVVKGLFSFGKTVFNWAKNQVQTLIDPLDLVVLDDKAEANSIDGFSYCNPIARPFIIHTNQKDADSISTNVNVNNMTVEDVINAHCIKLSIKKNLLLQVAQAYSIVYNPDDIDWGYVAANVWNKIYGGKTYKFQTIGAEILFKSKVYSGGEYFEGPATDYTLARSVLSVIESQANDANTENRVHTLIVWAPGNTSDYIFLCPRITYGYYANKMLSSTTTIPVIYSPMFFDDPDVVKPKVGEIVDVEFSVKPTLISDEFMNRLVSTMKSADGLPTERDFNKYLAATLNVADYKHLAAKTHGDEYKNILSCYSGLVVAHSAARSAYMEAIEASGALFWNSQSEKDAATFFTSTYVTSVNNFDTLLGACGAGPNADKVITSVSGFTVPSFDGDVTTYGKNFQYFCGKMRSYISWGCFNTPAPMYNLSKIPYWKEQENAIHFDELNACDMSEMMCQLIEYHVYLTFHAAVQRKMQPDSWAYIPYRVDNEGFSPSRYRIKTDAENEQKVQNFLTVVIIVAIVAIVATGALVTVKKLSRLIQSKRMARYYQLQQKMYNGNTLTTKEMRKFNRLERKLGLSDAITGGLLQTTQSVADSAKTSGQTATLSSENNNGRVSGINDIIAQTNQSLDEFSKTTDTQLKGVTSTVNDTNDSLDEFSKATDKQLKGIMAEVGAIGTVNAGLSAYLIMMNKKLEQQQAKAPNQNSNGNLY